MIYLTLINWLHVPATVTMQPIYCSCPSLTDWKISNSGGREKFIFFPTPGLFAWRVTWSLLWPVLYQGAQMIPRELSWQYSVVYRILQDFTQWFPVLLPSKIIDFFSPSSSTEEFERVISERVRAKILHVWEHSLFKTERWKICLRDQMQMKTTVFKPLTHQKEELHLQIFLIRNISTSAFIYGRIFAKPSKQKGWVKMGQGWGREGQNKSRIRERQVV